MIDKYVVYKRRIIDMKRAWLMEEFGERGVSVLGDSVCHACDTAQGNNSMNL